MSFLLELAHERVRRQTRVAWYLVFLVFLVKRKYTDAEVLPARRLERKR